MVAVGDGKRAVAEGRRGARVGADVVGRVASIGVSLATTSQLDRVLITSASRSKMRSWGYLITVYLSVIKHKTCDKRTVVASFGHNICSITVIISQNEQSRLLLTLRRGFPSLPALFEQKQHPGAVPENSTVTIACVARANGPVRLFRSPRSARPAKRQAERPT